MTREAWTDVVKTFFGSTEAALKPKETSEEEEEDLHFFQLSKYCLEDEYFELCIFIIGNSFHPWNKLCSFCLEIRFDNAVLLQCQLDRMSCTEIHRGPQQPLWEFRNEVYTHTTVRRPSISFNFQVRIFAFTAVFQTHPQRLAIWPKWDFVCDVLEPVPI